MRGDAHRKAPEYVAWLNMKARCNYVRHPNFANYGGRGIRVCDRWKSSYDNFIADMGPRPTPFHSLDRVDVNGNYERRNCRWLLIHKQQHNRRDSVRAEYRGEIVSVAAFAASHGADLRIATSRVRRLGWDLERAIRTPVVRNPRIAAARAASQSPDPRAA